MDTGSLLRSQRQDTFDLRDQMITDDPSQLAQAHGEAYPSDEEHSVLEDDSDTDDRDGDYADEDDRSSSLSIPNESIDFDLVYSLHSFAATVEGQASVVKGDSLVLMDDSNSYWWLVRVLKTQEIGYIPAENIETPFERLARLNKHRNVDLASATQAEMQNGLQESRDRFRNNMSSRTGSNQQTPSPTPGAPSDSRIAAARHARRSVIFTPALQVHRYPPAVWGEEEEEDDETEWDVGGYEDEDPSLAEEAAGLAGERSDDGMSWEDPVPDSARARQLAAAAQEEQRQQELQVRQLQQQQQQQQQEAELQQQQQRQQVEEQRRQQQQALAQQQQQQQANQQSQGSTLSIRRPDSRDRLAAAQESPASTISPTSPGIPSGGIRPMDPAEALDTKKISVTPSIVRTELQPQSTGPMLPSAVMQRQEEERKRTREEIEALEEAARKKAKASGSASGKASPGPAKLRKDRESGDEDSGKDKDKKGKSGLFGGLFGRRKDKHKEKGSSGSVSETGHGDTARSSEESGRSSNHQADMSAAAQRQLQVNTQQPYRGPAPQTPPQASQEAAARANQQSPVSQHAIQLRQRDKEHQALYQQYLNRSPASPPEVQPSFGLQSASAVHPNASYGTSNSLSPPGEGRRPRPGSLVLAPNTHDGQGGVPELSVIRVFAGKKLQTEATFKTVLLNSSTTSSDLVRQAIQRFRLPAGEDANDYYLTVKQMEGSSAMLRPDERPLVVFETLVEAALELPKVKRSSVGSISSIASNLSMHPAIKKLPMNDFTDDSAVKFYLNRRGEGGADDSMNTDEGDMTLMAESVQGDDSLSPTRPQYLSPTQGTPTVPPERFSSPSFRFALKLVIYPEDLPDDMVFDPLTEAIVFKNTLRDRSQASAGASPGISQAYRRKIFVFPKNITVAEVIEISLERFGILEGVVDGGDEIEDKMTKRRSSTRLRYALHVNADGKERELAAASKVIDAYTRPPTYRAVDRRFSDNKRRSVDSMQLLGNPDDVHPDDPVFILRRAITYRASSTRHRLSAPLDEIALQHLHRESMSSSSATSEAGAGADSEPKQRHMSKQELITAQRAASRANQRAILSAQTNSVRGVDVLLPGNAMLRSSRYNVDDRTRYSYIQPDGEAYDISDIMEEVWRGEIEQKKATASGGKGDLLEGVLSPNRAGLSEKLDRVLSKIKDGKGVSLIPSSPPSSASTVDSIASAYSNMDPSDDDTKTLGQPNSRSTTPSAAQLNARSGSLTGQRVVSPAPASGSRTATPVSADGKRARTATPTSSSSSKGSPDPHLRQPSIASVMSDTSGYRTAVGSPVQSSPSVPTRAVFTPKPVRPKPVIPKDDFGVSHMMAIIELAGLRNKTPPLSPMDPVDELLFGREIDLETLHPHIREIYGPSFQQLDDMDKILDDLLHNAVLA
ncbi:hypothetical protein BV25DRAFT_1889997 [Artomyces pyxidatus]|uniref:Uncharacterized protein n=1 Tax=Artomyces pyxidatus TaxID=48021 RepID=A0ACB8SSD1_9AGAM|nr:hypothetical protein BV25DRAFT_1889997 [Artomyces pyxidatus]